jgi:hypothetical protein
MGTSRSSQVGSSDVVKIMRVNQNQLIFLVWLKSCIASSVFWRILVDASGAKCLPFNVRDRFGQSIMRLLRDVIAANDPPLPSILSDPRLGFVTAPFAIGAAIPHEFRDTLHDDQV